MRQTPDASDSNRSPLLNDHHWLRVSLTETCASESELEESTFILCYKDVFSLVRELTLGIRLGSLSLCLAIKSKSERD